MNAPAKLNTEALPEWRLDDLFSGRDDPKIAERLAKAAADNDALVKMKGAFLGARGNADRLGMLLAEAIRLYEAATNGLWTVGAYASLSASVARDDPAWAKFEADIRGKSSAIAAESLFFTLELNALEEWEIEAALRANPAAARYRPWLRRVRLGRPHELSADLERMLVDRGPAVANWTRLYDETLSRLTATVGRETLTLAEALNRLSDPDPKQRKAAAQGLAKALEVNASVLGLALNTVAMEKAVEDRWRKFDSPAASRHLANEVDAASVAAMEEAVVEAYPRLSHRYYALKAKLMGKKVLDHWDRNAPSIRPSRKCTAGATPRGWCWTPSRASPPSSPIMPAPSSTTPGSTRGREAANRRAPIPTRSVPTPTLTSSSTIWASGATC